jgi:hypothetical protein
LLDSELRIFSDNANAATDKAVICYPAEDNILFFENDTCYSIVEWGDIYPDELDSCAKSNDPGCKGKYGFWEGSGRFAQPLVEIGENGKSGGESLSRHVTAGDWQSQDGAPYMRAGLGAIVAVEYLMTLFEATEHGLRDGSAYRTANRTKELSKITNGRASTKSHHMEGGAADILLMDVSGKYLDKCAVMKTAVDLIQGEVKHEGTVHSVHFAVPAPTSNDYWRCRK